MGMQKHIGKIESLFKKSPIVDFCSIEKIVGKKDYAKLLVHNLISKKRIFKIAKGKYSTSNNLEFSVFAFKPSYLGLQDALSFYGLWEQETIPVIITSRNVRQGIRKIMGVNVFVRRINRKYLFGIEYKKQNDFYLPYSDVEKTFIDMIYFREKMNESAFKEFKKIIDKKKLKTYLQNYPRRFEEKVMRIFGK
jgi:predicted transcriptional regulator of viral defense system